MRTAPTNWDNIVNTDSYHYDFKLVMNGTEYFPEDIMEMNSVTLAMVSSGTIPAIGGALAGELEVTLKYSGDDSLYNVPRMATLTPYIRVVTDDGAQSSGWLQMSQYMIDTREVDKASGNFKLHAYDAMLKAEQTYFPSVTDDSMPSGDVVSEIAALIGVSVNADTLSLLSAFSYEIPYYAGQYTAREMLQYIGVASGGNFYIDNNNELTFVRVAEFIGSDDLDGGQIASWTTWDSADGGTINPWSEGDSYYGGRISPWNGGTYEPDTIDIGSRAQSLTTDDEVEPYTQIVLVLDSQQEVTAGTGANIYEADCPFATPDMADFLLMMFERYSFRPFTAEKALITPLFEFGDSVIIAGETVKPYRYELNYNVLMAAELGADYSREVNHEFTFKPASERKIERVAANTYSQFQIMASEISSKVSQTDYNGNEIASLINQTATTIAISASKLNFSGEDIEMRAGTIKFVGGGDEESESTSSSIDFTYDGRRTIIKAAAFNRYYNGNNIIYIGADGNHVESGLVLVKYNGEENAKVVLYAGASGDGIISLRNSNDVRTVALSAVGYLRLYDSSNVNRVYIGNTGLINVYNSSGTRVVGLYESTTANDGTVAIFNSGGTNTVTLSGQYGTGRFSSAVTATAFINSSLINLKNGLKKSESMLDKVLDTDILSFNYNNEEEGAKKHFGVVIGDDYKCPDEIIADDGEGIDLYSMRSVLWKAVQEQNVIIKALKTIGGGLIK